jgi:hypothetical protein
MPKRITAGELVDKLMSDPDFVARRRREDEEREERMAEFRRAEEPLVRELQAAGFPVQSAWDLVNTPGSYPKAVPILLAHLPRSYPSPVREGIARALAVPESRAAWETLVRWYRDESDPQVKCGLALAIRAASDRSVIGDVIGLASDASNGPSRALLLHALERSTDSRGRAALVDLAADPDLAKEVRVILRRINRAHR